MGERATPRPLTTLPFVALLAAIGVVAAFVGSTSEPSDTVRHVAIVDMFVVIPLLDIWLFVRALQRRGVVRVALVIFTLIVAVGVLFMAVAYMAAVGGGGMIG